MAGGVRSCYSEEDIPLLLRAGRNGVFEMTALLSVREYLNRIRYLMYITLLFNASVLVKKCQDSRMNE